MTDDGMPDPLPDDVADLLRAERRVPPAPTHARAHVASRLRATLGAPVSGALSGTAVVAAGVRNFPARAKLLALLAGLGLVSGGGVAVWRATRKPAAAEATAKPAETRVESAPASPPAVLVPPVVVVVPPVVVARVEVRDAGTVAVARVEARDPAQAVEVHAVEAHARVEHAVRDESDHDLESERLVLAAAREAIGRRDGSAALSSLDEHKRTYAHGRLVQEREAMRVQALVLVGRNDEARRAAEAFARRYPDSVLLPMVQRVLEPEE